MPVDAQAAIQALIQAELLTQRRKAGPDEPTCVVALSRELGTGGLALAERLSERLGLPLFEAGIRYVKE